MLRVADAVAEVILYTGGIFGKQLLVTETEEQNVAGATIDVPSAYATSEALTQDEETVIAAQVALNYFFHSYATQKVQERIADEGQEWEYTLSANLVRDALNALIGDRDRALEVISQNMALDRYESFLAVRDAHVAAVIEPWTASSAGAGQEVDWRFS